MTKRGRILRDTNAGPGLLMLEGKQYSFVLEGMWQSEIPPRTGMSVDVQLDGQGTPLSLQAVSDSQLASEQASQVVADVKRKGGAFAETTLSRFGVGTSVAFAALVIGWFMLSTVSLTAGPEGLDITFWQLLGYVNNGHALADFGPMVSGVSPSKGIFGLLCIVSLGGPLVRFFRLGRRSALAGLLPLLFMMLAFYLLRSHILQAAGGARAMLGKAAADRVMNEFMQHVSFGVGVYTSIASSLYFALIAVKKVFLGT